MHNSHHLSVMVSQFSTTHIPKLVTLMTWNLPQISQASRFGLTALSPLTLDVRLYWAWVLMSTHSIWVKWRVYIHIQSMTRSHVEIIVVIFLRFESMLCHMYESSPNFKRESVSGEVSSPWEPLTKAVYQVRPDNFLHTRSKRPVFYWFNLHLKILTVTVTRKTEC